MDTPLDRLMDTIGEVITEMRDAAPRRADDADTGEIVTVLRDIVDQLAIVFPHTAGKRQAEAILQNHADETTRYHRARTILGLDKPRSGALANLIALGEDTYIATVVGGPFKGQYPFTIIFRGEPTREYHETLDMALLALVEMRANDGQQTTGFVAAAARVLGVAAALRKLDLPTED